MPKGRPGHQPVVLSCVYTLCTQKFLCGHYIYTVVYMIEYPKYLCGHILHIQLLLYTQELCVPIFYIQLHTYCLCCRGGAGTDSISTLGNMTPIVKSVPTNQVIPSSSISTFYHKRYSQGRVPYSLETCVSIM